MINTLPLPLSFHKRSMVPQGIFHLLWNKTATKFLNTNTVFTVFEYVVLLSLCNTAAKNYSYYGA